MVQGSSTLNIAFSSLLPIMISAPVSPLNVGLALLYRMTIAELQEQELRLVGVREKLSRFIEALESFNAEPTFDSATWNSLVERVLVNPRNLIFEFKNGEKIKISI